jgi:hypothetical protein
MTSTQFRKNFGSPTGERAERFVSLASRKAWSEKISTIVEELQRTEA